MAKTRSIPDKMGSYSEDDAIFLLREISAFLNETSTETRESLIQSGIHYSEMLPKEYQPTEEYITMFRTTLKEYSRRVAISLGVVAELVAERRGLDNLVLVSLARAGTPIGVLLKRYLQENYQMNIPHYSISIIRGRGIDERALSYIFEQHPLADVQFVDGWTGKGAILKQLQEDCEKFNQTHTQTVEPSLAVLADPGHCTDLFGTRDDFLIPSACLNSTVSGLVSRTVLNHSFMDKDDFHGAKYYKELMNADVSNLYVDTIQAEFHFAKAAIKEALIKRNTEDCSPSWKGMQTVDSIKKLYNIENVHFIKPGVGETTRVLLRRVPWKILINPANRSDLSHILMLARDRNVPVEEFPDMSYSCCGIIKDMRE
ncbi:cysteine protease StiP family protein [Bacillus sp. 1P06AnD]|uniref:cysteine protease StiP family protein n=1 Tax=Bacillus sp. 1P06AnD TaxID=3132208 RepID=UPI0039A38A78